ncbi:Threonylcarbamoyl-AMP synthase [[Mycoplasma] cavipharyngis]|uniref:L-threonylcarbamoyladenylate synthase n=1 Tax=[Mycoplasma] cavipharyngis TaxID=92757 RepID=UPI00370439B9
MKIYHWDDLDLIISELKKQKAAIVKTDTVNGIIACDPNVIYDLKDRAIEKKLIVFINSLAQINQTIPADLQSLLAHFWPGALTIVLNGLSYRIPNDQPLLNLINKIGPLYSSSANISNYPVVQNYQDIKMQFAHKSDLFFIIAPIAPNINSNSTMASTVFDYDQKMILRKGPISAKAISAFCQLKNNKTHC